MDEITAHLAMMVGGRPFEWKDGVLTVSHENGKHHVDIKLDAADLAAFEHTRDRVIKPAVDMLDHAAFPDRSVRFMDACRAYNAAVLSTRHLTT